MTTPYFEYPDVVEMCEDIITIIHTTIECMFDDLVVAEDEEVGDEALDAGCEKITAYIDHITDVVKQADKEYTW